MKTVCALWMMLRRMRSRNFDLSVYFVADPAVCGGRDVADVVSAAARGGATMIQLRNKNGEARDFLDQAKVCQAVLKDFKIPFIVNDRVDIALAVDADGVHLGQDDMPPAEARKILGPNKIIGQTAFTLQHFQKIDPAVVDYAGTGPFYETQTKPGKPVLGAERFRNLIALSPVPVVGIGGITPENCVHVIASGANGIAMMRSVSENPDPEYATREFVQIVQTTKMRKAS